MKFIDQIEKIVFSYQVKITYILTRERIFDSLFALFSVTFDVRHGGFVNGN